MSVVVSQRFHAFCSARRRFYEFDIPKVGILNIELFGLLTWRCFSVETLEDGRSVEAFLGPVHIEFEYQPKTRAKRGTLAVLAMTSMAAAGWTEGHLWSLPFLG